MVLRDTQDYCISFKREKETLRHQFIEDLHGLKHLMARLIGFDGAYLRSAREVSLDRYDGEKVVESKSGPALWELMCFAKAHPH